MKLMLKLLLIVWLISASACTAAVDTADESSLRLNENLVAGFYTYRDGQPFSDQSLNTSSKALVYMHGTRSAGLVEYCGKWSKQVPESVLSLDADPDTTLYYLCSDAVDKVQIGSYIDGRLADLDGALDQLLTAGATPENISLVGHSAGGWVALLAASRFPHKFNSVVAFGPSCCGKREDEPYYPEWRTKVRPRQIEQMLTADNIKALVFAYADDPFNRPQDLEFLQERFPETVEFYGYNCEGGHNTHIDDCEGDLTKQRIAEFLDKHQ